MKKINLLVLPFALLGAVLIFSIATTRAVETNETNETNETSTSIATTTNVEVLTANTVATTTSTEEVTTKAKPAKTINLNGKTLERIPNPEQIKNFRVMKNENGALYGIRIKNTNQTQSSNQSAHANDKARENANANSAVASNGQALERIPNPEQIKNFRVMKNENGALYGIRIKNTNQNQVREREEEKTREEVKTKNRLVTADIKACVSTAINTKDEALKTRLTNMSQEVSALIDARNACQNIALESETNQADNLKACSVTFEAKYKELNNATRENHKNIWTNYQSQMKACLPAQEAEEGETLLIEDGGSNTLETTISL